MKMPKEKSAKALLILSLFLVVSFSSFAQKWEKRYPIPHGASMNWVIESYDKGFFMGASDFVSQTIKLYKTDINGKILWQRRIAGHNPILGGITATSDGGLAISGALYRTDSTNAVFIIKLNVCGEMDWSKIYDLNQYTIGGSIFSLKNGDLIVSNTVSIYNKNIFNFYNTWNFCTDANGNLKWQNFDNLYWNSAHLDNKDNILTSGFVYRTDPDKPDGVSWIRSTIQNTNSDGKNQWAAIYGIENKEYGQAVATVETADNGYLSYCAKRDIKGYTFDKSILIKFGQSGKYQWSKTIGDTTIENNPFDISRINDSTFLLMLATGNSLLKDFYSGDIRFLKISDKGEILKQFVYPYTGIDMSFYKLRPTSDGKFITAGIMAYNPSEDSLLVLKINGDLELDTFYTHDKNKYDYRCTRKIAFDSTINQSTDTIHIVIPYPDIPKPGSFLVYPNPTSSSQIQIRTEASQCTATLTVYDMLGRRINIYQFVPGQTGHTNINLGAIAPGCYILALEQDGKRYVQKLIVE